MAGIRTPNLLLAGLTVKPTAPLTRWKSEYMNNFNQRPERKYKERMKKAQLSDSYFEIFGLISSWRRSHILSIHDVSCDCGLGVDRLTSAINSNKLSPVHGRDAREAWCSVTIGLCDKPTPGKILPLTISHSGRTLSVKYLPPPWDFYPLIKKKKNQASLSFHIHEYWILLRLFGWYKSDFQADHICCPIHMHLWNRVNVQVPVMHGSRI